MQHRGGLAGAAVADEAQTAAAPADAGGMQRHQSLRAGGEREDCKLYELVTNVIWKPEQVPRHHDERRALFGGHERDAGAFARAAEQSRRGQHREWAGLIRTARPTPARRTPGVPTAAEHQPDHNARRRCRQAVPRQAVIGPTDEAHQLRAFSRKFESAAEDLTVNPQQAFEALVERIYRDVAARAQGLRFHTKGHPCDHCPSP